MNLKQFGWFLTHRRVSIGSELRQGKSFKENVCGCGRGQAVQDWLVAKALLILRKGYDLACEILTNEILNTQLKKLPESETLTFTPNQAPKLSGLFCKYCSEKVKMTFLWLCHTSVQNLVSSGAFVQFCAPGPHAWSVPPHSKEHLLELQLLQLSPATPVQRHLPAQAPGPASKRCLAA